MVAIDDSINQIRNIISKLEEDNLNLTGGNIMYLTHYNDGKGKWQSHEIEFNEDNFADYKRMIFSLDPTSIIGYGSTKEEAFKDFKEKFCFVMEQLKTFESTLNSAESIDNVREKYE